MCSVFIGIVMIAPLQPTICHYFIRLLKEKGLLLRCYTQVGGTAGILGGRARAGGARELRPRLLCHVTCSDSRPLSQPQFPFR